jgi:hypothetical protein
MRNANKTVTAYRKTWDSEQAADVYKGTVIRGVSFFSRIANTVSTEAMTASCEAILRIPEENMPEGLDLKNGDLICEGALQTDGVRPADLNALCPYVFTIISVTKNLSVMGSHVKVVCK